MDVRSTRAHVCQILNTAASINLGLSLFVVLPKYHRKVDFGVIKRNHDLPRMPKLVFIRNFGIQKSGITAFVLFNVPAIFFLIKKKINKEIDFLYFRSSYFLPLATSAYILGIPFFYETHRRPVSRSERCRDHAMSAMATGFIVISSYMREHYLPYKKKILVAHDAVSLKRFAGAINKDEARKKLGLAPDEKVCVYAGTVSKLKGMEYVIAAAKILPKILFLLVGFVSMEFTNDSLPKNVKLLGRVGQEDLPAILQAADILLLPHPKGEYSQSPMKLFEYMASSVPIVASRLPSISEVLNDNNAVLVEAENEEALARGVERLIKDRNLSRVIAEKAYSDVQDYTWKKRGATIAEFIRKVIREQNKK